MMLMMIIMVCSSLSLSRERSGSVEGLFYFWSDQAEECNPCTVCPQVGRDHKHDDGVLILFADDDDDDDDGYGDDDDEYGDDDIFPANVAALLLPY